MQKRVVFTAATFISRSYAAVDLGYDIYIYSSQGMQQPLNNLRSVVTDSNEDKPRNGKLVGNFGFRAAL